MNNFGTLYVIATPIGNLKDITLRALEVLKNVDLIACEDTRVTQKLLRHYNIQKPLISYHQHSSRQRENYLKDLLTQGKNIALVTDSGTPGISDPGNKLVGELVKDGFLSIPIPGPSALTALVSVAGIDMQRFAFMGFPPHKKGRETFFREISVLRHPVLYYESPHRLLKNLELLNRMETKKNVIVGRELTKMFEEIVRGSIEEVQRYFSEKKGEIKGELAIIIF
ncbi:MAG: 16S rRNA (cytidine(1402)-2'-O)-methyltransferase [Candidatus Moranbacteria bacterium]|nr:16S rRNA (cytidine(1402)-2'-O)-methyltransferase [Candidatus Moranbacteria bacterium]